MSDAFDVIRTIIVSVLGVETDRITLDANFRDDLGADSLDLIEIVLILEELLRMRIPDHDVRKLQNTVGEAVQFFEAHRHT